MKTLSLYDKIKAEYARFLNVEKWPTLKDEDQQILRDQIILNFKNEQTESWAAAALALGKLATHDREAGDYLQICLLNATNLHRIRHVFTALGAYAATLTAINKNEDRELIFLSRYRDLVAKKDKEGNRKEFDLAALKQSILASDQGMENTGALPGSMREFLGSALKNPATKKAVNTYFSNILDNPVSCSQAGARQVINELLSEMFHSQLLSEQADDASFVSILEYTFFQSWWNNEGKNKLVRDIEKKKGILERNPENPGLAKRIERLEGIQNLINSNAPQLSLSDVIAAINKNIDRQIQRICNYNHILKTDDLEDWVVASLVLSLPEIAKSDPDFDLPSVLRHLVNKETSPYLKNIPFVLLWQHNQPNNNWQEDCGRLIFPRNCGHRLRSV